MIGGIVKEGCDSLHLVDDASICFGQDHGHGRHVRGEFLFVWFQPVQMFAENLSSVLCLQHINRPYGDPSDAYHLIHVSLVYGLLGK